MKYKLTSFTIFLVLIFGLAGCVNYAGMRANTKPYSFKHLRIPHVYETPTSSAIRNQANWWQRFNDPQLNRLIAIALCDSPDMHAAESRVKRAIYLAKSAGAELWPSIDASGYVERERFSLFGIVPPPFNGRTFNIGDIALNFNYEFDFWGKHRQEIAARVSEVCAAEADRAEARLVISTAIADVYFQLQSNIAQLKIAQATAKQREEIFSITKYRAAHGIESDIPVKTALTDMQNAKLNVNQYELLGKLLRHQLAVLIGKNPFVTDISINKFSYHKNYIKMPPILPANFIAQRPDIAASRLRVEATAHQINVAKARFFPNINLFAFLSYQSVGLGHLFDKESQNNAIGGAIDLPIFDAGARRANLGVRYAEYDYAVSTYNKAILTALQEVMDQISNLHTLSAQLMVQDTALAAARRNYKMTTSRYNHGIVDYLPVLQVQGTLLQQQALQIEYQTRHLRTVVAMIKALGGDCLLTER